MKKQIRQCAQCGKELKRYRPGHIYCSRECHDAAWRLVPQKARPVLGERMCVYCGNNFMPKSAKRMYCSAACRRSADADFERFDGMRRTAVGFDDKQCWICRKDNVSVQAHHVIGFRDDSHDPLLVVLCRGCHQLVTSLGRRVFLDDPGKVADLLTLARFAKQLPDAKTVVRYEETQEANNMPDNGAQVSSPGLHRRESAQVRETAGDSPSANGRKARAAVVGRRQKSGTTNQQEVF